MPQPVRVDRPGPGPLPGGEHRLGDAGRGQRRGAVPGPAGTPAGCPRTAPGGRRAGRRRSPRRHRRAAGSRSLRLPLPRTVISPARQSMSSRLSAATSPARSPSRASKVSIAKSRRPAAVPLVAAGQQRGDLSGLQRPRQPGQPPAGDRGHRPVQRPGDLARNVQVAQQRPQRGHRQLRRALRACPGRSASTNAVTSAAVSAARSSAPASSRPARNGRTISA